MRNLLERAIWTGVQTGLALLTVEGLSTFDATATQSLLIAGTAAVLSALKTLSVERLAALNG